MSGWTAAAVAVAGTVTAATGAIVQGVQASKTAKYNAKVNEIKATAARIDAAENESRFRRTSAQRLGTIRAGRQSEGSALDILEDSATEEELQALSIRHQGEVQAIGFEHSAALDRSRGKSAMAGGFLQAGSALLLGGSGIKSAMPDGSANTTSGRQIGDPLTPGMKRFGQGSGPE